MLVKVLFGLALKTWMRRKKNICSKTWKSKPLYVRNLLVSNGYQKELRCQLLLDLWCPSETSLKWRSERPQIFTYLVIEILKRTSIIMNFIIYLMYIWSFSDIDLRLEEFDNQLESSSLRGSKNRYKRSFWYQSETI